MSGIRPPACTSSNSTSVLSLKVVTCSPVPWRLTTPSYGKMSMTSPIFSPVTSISMGSAPESSIVLKKMGAILPPMHTPPVRLLGTHGMSSPMNHWMELVALFLELPVPTTSPTYASGWPLALSSSTCLGASCIPSLGFLSIARAWSGMSGRLQASCAGLKSSVLVSPVTLNTVTVILSGTGARLVNHSPSAHDVITSFAAAHPPLALASTSWKASNMRSVNLSACAAAGASSASPSASTSGVML
mmetsp:Transcript_5880/g.20511  ORF Transcript_5880/g.20511 Transcript_5880/m.20511 type:complete len:245 (+) Transcript_5880:1693-2427(+)